MSNELYADGIGEITITGTIVRIDLMSLSATDRDANNNPKPVFRQRIIMVALTAPADAVVLDLAQRSVGSVVREAEPVVTLVPINVPLEAEVSINTRDIGRIAVGKEARIKLDAYPFQKYGTASGEVRTISQDTFVTGQQQDPNATTAQPPAAPFFKARILLADTRLNVSDVPVRLLPGMTVSTEIKVGNRTVMSYFLYPLLRGLDDAIREPN